MHAAMAAARDGDHIILRKGIHNGLGWAILMSGPAPRWHEWGCFDGCSLVWLDMMHTCLPERYLAT